jgi:hypothetical protein
MGSGVGAGIRVLAGGYQGATIEGGAGKRGVVAGFGTGLRATGRRAVAEVNAVDFTANARDGVALWGHEVRLVDVTADKNGRDGLHIGGREASLEGVRGDRNGRYGVRVNRDAARIEGTAVDNGRANVVKSLRAEAEPK